MKLTSATEQALAIIAMLATQEDNIPASSSAIYQRLSVSQSYIKKLLRKLVVSKIITGVSGNNGGFFIERDLADISLLEIVEAIEGKLDSFPHIGVLERAFSPYNELVHNGNIEMTNVFQQADKAWSMQLEQVSIQDVLSMVFLDDSRIKKRDWNKEA